jgi:hypothetical protein
MIASLFLEPDDTSLLILIRCKYRLGAYENFECTIIFRKVYMLKHNNQETPPSPL